MQNENQRKYTTYLRNFELSDIKNNIYIHYCVDPLNRPRRHV